MPDSGPIRFMLSGRLLTLAIMLVCLFLPGASQDADETSITVLVDRSDFDMQAEIDAVGAQVRQAIEAQDANIDVSAASFGGTAAAKDMDKALQESLWAFEPDVRNALVIVSSGYWRSNSARTLRQTSAAGIPVYWLPVVGGDTEPRIVSIDSQARARPGQAVLVSVAIEATEPGNYVVEIFANSNRVGRDAAGRDGRAAIPFTVGDSGSVRIDAVLLDADTGMHLDEMLAATTINIASTTNLLAIADEQSELVASLAKGGWPITHVVPGELERLPRPFSAFSAVILDDIAANELPEARWTELIAAVERDAVGLLVLGGPNSFGLGAYRGSKLEQLLPVISEPPDTETPAAIVFLVDSSGSMGRQAGTTDGLSAARDAAQFAAAALRPADKVGLIAFDAEARQLLTVSAREDHAGEIRSAWPTQASGGTSIGPALVLAHAALATDAAEQKMVFLMTDGMLSADDLEELRLRSQSEDFELVAMIVAKGQAGSPVSRQQLSDKTTLLIVDDVLRLPQLMRNELENLRAPLTVGQITPVVMAPMPMREVPDAWPDLDAYAVVRARPEATVMLADAGGAPLAASWVAGSGRVITLSGGLGGAWARDWLEWSRWPELVTGLVDHVAVRDAGAASPAIEADETGRNSIILDEAMAEAPKATITAQLWPPAGAPIEIVFEPDAPDRYRAPLALDQPGEFTLVWEAESGIRRHSFVSNAARIRRSNGEALGRRLVNEGVLREWSAASAAELVQPMPWRTLSTALAIVLLILAIAWERLPIASQITKSMKQCLSVREGSRVSSFWGNCERN